MQRRSDRARAVLLTLAATLAGSACGGGGGGPAVEPVPPPVAAFSFLPASPLAGAQVQFTDGSSGAPTSWSWDLGDGATSTAQHPTHAYAAAGTYAVTLQAGNAGGSSSVTQQVTVAAPVASPPFTGDVVLGAPTATSIRVSLLSPDQLGTVTVQYGAASGAWDGETTPAALLPGEPLVVTVAGLQPATRHRYRVAYKAMGADLPALGPERTFQTARAAGSTFTFTVQADSHLDANSSLDVYRRALANVLADGPDFHLDLGDTFMCEKHSQPFDATVVAAPDEATVRTRYAYERSNFAQVAHSTPLFLVNGNHEGEAGWLGNGTASSLPVWTTRARQRYFPVPEPDGFYSGDAVAEPFVGLRGAWYAWRWGDALFVALDPYWATPSKPGQNGWALTLGARQYRWLEETLAASTATYKFVFLHNLVGGLDGQMRGGVEAAPYYEWGGKNADGSDGFAANRPGWAEAIHPLLVRHGVTAVFHGHDHLYARQSLDGIVYQEVPQPSTLNTGSGPALAAQYHYASGTILGSSGHLRVTVGPAGVKAEYVRAWLPASENATRRNGQVDDTWTVAPPGGATLPAAVTTNAVLGRPTATSIAASVLAEAGAQAFLEYGTSPGAYLAQTPVVTSAAGEAVVLEASGLAPATRHWYRVRYRAAGATAFGADVERTFRTQAAAGATFSFGVQGDSHPERAGLMFDAALYQVNARNVAARAPDLYFCLGDDFSIEALLSAGTVSQATVDPVYRLQRDALGLLGHSSAVFLVNGNHEQAARYLYDNTTYQTPHALAPVYAARARLAHYALPAPDAFYSGDAEVLPGVGLLRDYYAFQWGDALFVTIDPYWHSPVPVDNGAPGVAKVTDGWLPTIGDAQYAWLKQVLETSTARYKFVFEHHLLGSGRGAVRLAHTYEWGGWDPTGKAWEFGTRRPGWAKPVHQLLRDTGVTVFFFGHDHLFAREVLDGVTYQSVPNPADDTYATFNADAYGPASITFPGASYDPSTALVRPNAGFLHVTVAPAAATVEYVRAVLPGDEVKAGAANGEVSASYTVAPR